MAPHACRLPCPGVQRQHGDVQLIFDVDKKPTERILDTGSYPR